MVDPQAKRMHTAKKTLSGRGGNEGNTNEPITVTWKTKRERFIVKYIYEQIIQMKILNKKR